MEIEWTNEDWLGIAAMRPGMRFQQFISPWRDKVKVLEDADGDLTLTSHAGDELCSVSIDGEGLVCFVSFGDPRVVVDSIRCEMSLAELRQKVPGLVRDYSDIARDLKRTEDLDCYEAPYADSVLWGFMFSDESLVSIMLSQDDEPQRYVDPVFDDLNFKLAVLASLIRDQRAALPTEIDEEEDEDGVIPSHLDACCRMTLDRSQLDSVERLEFDSGSDVYNFIAPMFDGESNVFDIVGIEGIGELRNLKTLSIISMTENLSLLPLANHPTLEEIKLSPQTFKDFRALESIATLKRVKGFFDEIYEEDAEVLERLLARGIDVVTYE